MKNILFTIIDGKVKPVRIDYVVGSDFVIMRVGDDKHPISEEELGMISNEIEKFSNGKFLVCPHNVKIEIIEPKGKVIKIKAGKKMHGLLQKQFEKMGKENCFIMMPFEVDANDSNNVLEFFLKNE
jgi:hypothetical protein